MNFPLLYCNGCSYSDENYHKQLKNNVYINSLQDYLGNGFVLNKAIKGSNNRRIIRTSLHDLYQQRNLNPDQKIIALIQLTFELRGELWYKSPDHEPAPEESDFITHQFSGQLDWKEKLLKFLDIGSDNPFISKKNILDNTFLKKYSEGRAYFYSPYQERINLYTDLVMFINVCNNLNIDYLFFAGPKFEKLESEYLLDFYKQLIPDDNIIDFEEFGFCSWCKDHDFLPLDEKENPDIGHYGADAHSAFAHSIIIPQLEKLKII